MARTIPQLVATLNRMGSDVVFHREDGGVPCPCRTREGFRDPAWHRANPLAPVCNEQGFLTTVNEFTVKAQIQPAVTGFSRAAQRASVLLGDVLVDDRIGIFPCVWSNSTVDFDNWSEAGEDFIVYDGDRYIVVQADKLPDIDGDPNHHWETGLRRVKDTRVTDA